MSDSICPVCNAVLESQGLHSWRCINCCKNDPLLMKKMLALDELTAHAQEMGLYDNRSEGLNGLIKKIGFKEAFDQMRDKCLDEPAFPFGPIPHWINVKDKLPEIDQEVLSYCENTYASPKATYPLGHKYFALDKYLKCGFRTDMLGYGKVLYWQALPEAPND